MRNEIIYNGLHITTDKCRYFQVVQGKYDTVFENENTSTLTITYSPGSSAKSLSNSLGLPLVGSGNTIMTPMSKPSRFSHPTITLNGLRLERLTYDPHIINIVIADDTESRVVQNYKNTVFVVSKADYKNEEFINYLFYSGQLLYLRPVGPRVRNYRIYNFPKLIIGDSDVEVESTNDTIYTLRKRYNDYLIREIDYQDKFLLEIRRILDDYGVELVRLNKEKTLTKSSYITYQFNQTPTNYSHPKRGDLERNIMSHKQPVEFVFHTTDMVLYHDFKNKYSDVLLLTNFVEFTTLDKYGDPFTAAVKWSSITEDFNHIYQPDDNSNFAFQCQFRCDLSYYEVLDTRFGFLEEINTILRTEDKDRNKKTSVEEEKTVKQDDKVQK